MHDLRTRAAAAIALVCFAAHSASADELTTSSPEAHWSFQQITRPAVPQGDHETPIDAFVGRRLHDAGIAANGPAGKRALIRRATYDLTGLPPTPDDVERFVDDTGSTAFNAVVDRLLASPAYGEKWGRHWLDLVRFAETNSYERDGTKPNAWRYRDYVINSFNADKPYDQFVREQLAGDEMQPRTPERLIATGFYRLGLWDDEPADEILALYDELDDVLTVTSQVFLGLTINCARCHDHKLDPIPQADYYRMLAFFAGVDRYGGPGRGTDHNYSQIPLLPPEEIGPYQSEHRAYLERLNKVQKQVRNRAKKFAAKLPPGEADDFAHEENRLAVLRKFVPNLFKEAAVARFSELLEQQRQIMSSGPADVGMALAVSEHGATPRATHVLLRGNPHAIGANVSPGYPIVLGFPDPEPSVGNGATCGRRSVLADWIASADNPLTARVIANRVWQYHFGTGLVATPSDFGLQGARPTHPELLDWLASELIEHNWSLKHLHRQIMNSAAYQRSSADDLDALQADSENQLLWRFPMRRLTAEEVRDSLLAITGQLNRKMGGPSIYPEIEEEVKAGQSRPGEGWGSSHETERQRRSVYIFIKRSLITPIIATLDGAEPDFSCPVRFATTTPTQSLTMMNGGYVQQQAEALAELALQQSNLLDEQVSYILKQVTQRPAKPAEVQRGMELVELLSNMDGGSSTQALSQFCVVAVNLNEFLYLD